MDCGTATQKQKAQTQKQKAETHFSIPDFFVQLLPFVRLIMAVIIAMSSSASFSIGRVSVGVIPHSSRSNSSHIWDSSVSWSAPPSFETNSSFDRARDDSRTWAATEVPDRNNCLPRIRASSRLLGSLINSRIVAAANCFVRSRNSVERRPFIVSKAESRQQKSQTQKQKS